MLPCFSSARAVRGPLALGLALFIALAWPSQAGAQSCGQAGGDYCSQSGGCPRGYDSLGTTYDCNPCCERGPSCGAIGGDWCSQTGSCPGGYQSLGGTYDCNPCCRETAPPPPPPSPPPAPPPPQGQMQFSASTSKTVSSNLSSLSVYTSVVDSSTGCSHANYSTTVVVRSPSGRVVSARSSGMTARATIPIAGEFGDYSIRTKVEYNCSCIRWGGAHWVRQETYPLPRPADLRKVGSDVFQETCDGSASCGGSFTYSLRRVWGVYDQYGSPWPFNAPVLATQAKTGVDSCNVTPVYFKEFSTNNRGRFFREYAADLTNACHTRPYCRSVLAETFVVMGYRFSHSLTFRCHGLTISRN